MSEIWKDIVGFPGYQASSNGNIRSFRDFHGNITSNSRILKTSINKDGYYELTIYTAERKKVTKRVHRLIAEAFLGRYPELVVNHINGNKLDNRIENLEFVTAEQNSRHAADNGLYKTKPVRIIETGEVFESIDACAKAVKTHPSNISNCLDPNSKKGQTTSMGLHFEVADKPKPKTKQFLYDHQMDAVKKMFNGCILNGGVGTGKSRTGLFYYFKENGGWIENQEYTPMKDPQDLYIITTAMKRDKLEWDGELTHYLMSTDPELNYYKNKIVIDSWNNIKKYVDVENAFFIFDEDRVTGSGAWVKAFYKIAKANNWIILSATSGDCWLDYVPVFVANGFYKNKTEFIRDHVQYARYSKYPKIERYYGTGRLIRLRNKILIDMNFERPTIPHHENIYCGYDTSMYKNVTRTRWDPYKDQPIEQPSGLCYVLRRIVNSDESRQVALLELAEEHPRMIIFYNFDYEREILLNIHYGDDVQIAEWNGHAHMPIPDSEKWIYIVQYTAGCEGWNSIATDTIVFYSQNYSYKVMTQAAGRIDRLNTPFLHLHYYHLSSRSGIDLAISRALSAKKKFNETKYVKW